jgi:hypothetical protein
MFLIGTDQITVYIFAIEQKKVNSQSKNTILETSSSLLFASNQNFTSREFSEIRRSQIHWYQARPKVGQKVKTKLRNISMKLNQEKSSGRLQGRKPTRKAQRQVELRMGATSSNTSQS